MTQEELDNLRPGDRVVVVKHDFVTYLGIDPGELLRRTNMAAYPTCAEFAFVSDRCSKFPIKGGKLLLSKAYLLEYTEPVRKRRDL